MKKIALLTCFLLLTLTSCNLLPEEKTTANEIIDSLTVDVNNETVTSDFTVPATITYKNKTYDLTWESENEKALTFSLNGTNYNAKITRSTSDVKVKFNASVKYNDETASKNFSITIAKEENIEPGVLPSDVTYTGYYADMTGSFSTYDSFFTTLNDIVKSTHTNELTYKEVWTVLQESDAYDSDNIECFYTGILLSKEARDGSGTTDGGKVWNREHVWAKSHGFNDEKYTAYADAHHLRATEKVINSSRNNSYFDEIVNPANTDIYGNKWNSKVFEPRDEVKGDVARILFYMVTRYHDSELTLTLDNTGNYNNEPTLGMLDTLIKWHYEDPVSETEIKRNEVVYTYQGNRNPYIDHPEFVYYLYQDESEELGITEETVLEKVKNDEVVEDTTISDLINDINSIKDKTITLEDKEILDGLQNRYNALSEADKTKVTNYGILEEKIKEYKELLGIKEITYDLKKFPSTGTSYGQVAEIEDQGVTFYTTNYSTKDDEFLLGFNTNNYSKPNSKYNVGNWSKYAVLEFNVKDLKGISFEVGTINSGFSGGCIIYSKDGINYEILYDLSEYLVEGQTAFYELTEAKSGYFGIVVHGSQPRMIIKNFTLTY